VELVINIAVWTIDFQVRSEAQEHSRLYFQGDPASWDFHAQLEPDEGSGTRTEGLIFRTGKPGRDRITTIVEAKSGHADKLTLELDTL
jgi:hypothetical protein